MAWTLTYGVLEKSFAEWGMIDVRFERDSQGDDVFAFNQGNALCTDDATFPDDAEITIKQDAVVWFVGRRVKNPRLGRPEIERLSYVFEGVWSYFKRRVFYQTWKSWDNATEALVDAYSSKVMLHQGATGGYLTTGQQIQEVVAWVIARNVADYSAPKLQLDTSDLPTVAAPYDEVTNLTCAEVIRRELRWSPHYVVWTDYTTTPPTLRIKPRGELGSPEVAIGDAEKHEAIDLTSREDLLVPSVRLTYRKSTDVDGVNKVATVVDIAPGGKSGLEENAFAETYDFDGGRVTTTSVDVVVEEIDLSDIEWWKKREPKLGDKRIVPLSIISATRELIREDGDPLTYLYELVEGDWFEWMGVEVADQVASAEVIYQLWDRDVSGGTAGAEMLDEGSMKVSCRIRGTNAETRTYASVASTGGESLPVGLAAQVFEAFAELHWEGRVSFVEEECSGFLGIGHVLNLTGGRPEWATMNALIQSVSYDLDAGRTIVQVGPSPLLGPGDLIELLRVNRSRQINIYPGSRTTAVGGGGGNVALGGKGPRAIASPLPTARRVQRWTHDPANPSGAGYFVETKIAGDSTSAQHAVATSADGVLGRRIVSKVTNGGSEVEIQITNAALKKTKVLITATNDDDVRIQMSSQIPDTGSIDLKLSDCLGKGLSVREISICYDGETKYLMGLFSDVYDTPASAP